MADDDQSTTPDGDTSTGVTINMSDYPAITEALQFSSGDQLMASIGIKDPSTDDTATA